LFIIIIIIFIFLCQLWVISSREDGFTCRWCRAFLNTQI